MKKIALTLLLGLVAPVLFGQTEKEGVTFQPLVHGRLYWMSTTYSDEFKEDFALGTSLSLGFRAELNNTWIFSTAYRGFLNAWSSAIWEPDPQTGLSNRYETGLFNLLQPGQRAFGSLEQIHLGYNVEKWQVNVGRMPILTPWVNPADGRLSPTLMEGASVAFRPSSTWNFSGKYIHRFQVRGTNRYLGVGESVGVYPTGRGLDGKPSAYAGNTRSKFVSILQARHEWESHQLTLSHTLADRLYSLFWSEWTHTWTRPNSVKWQTGFQFGFQHGVGDGGNPDPSLRYKDPDDSNWVVSGKINFNKSKWTHGLHVSHLGGKGRWLSPREWGRDAWFTFMSRERNEGLSSFTAVTVRSTFRLDERWLLYSHLGIHWLPSAADPEKNKYAMPAYRQINMGLQFVPSKSDRIDFHLLFMNKEALETTSGLPDGQRYNKVGLFHLNLILNYRIE